MKEYLKIQENKKKRMSKVMLIAMIVMAVLIIFYGLLIFPMMFEGSETSAFIKIPKNATAEMVADTLTKYFGKSYSDKIIRYAKVRGIKFSDRHGAYLIEEGTSPFNAMIKICRRGQTPVKITVNGFRSMDTLTDKVARKFEFSDREFMGMVRDSAFLACYGLTRDQALALFLDDTYEAYWTSTPEAVLKKIGDNYKNFWNPERVKMAADLGATPAEIMTIASIADEESNKADEKGKIGRLYLNRLAKGMKLQSDPTVRFALNDFTIRRVRGNHLKYDSPFNTYIYAGLPPGPIRTTSRATVDSILHSEPSDYIYMCADDSFSGYHVFASDYAEHVRNALKYQHALDRRGIK